MNYKTFVILCSIIFKVVNSTVTESESTPVVPPCHCKKEAHITPEVGCSGVFVNSYKLRIVFDWLVIDKAWYYALALVGLFGFSAMSPCIKAYREIIRTKVIKSYVFDCLLTHAFLFLVALIAYILDFMLMLIVMSFNVGVFFAITSGYAVGYVLSSMMYANYKMSNRSSSFYHVNEDCC